MPFFLHSPKINSSNLTLKPHEIMEGVGLQLQKSKKGLLA